MSNALKLILIAVSLLITCIVVKVGMIVVDNAKALSDTANEQITNMNQEMSNGEIMIYEDEVYGADVINAIKKLLGNYTSTETAPLYVYVKTSNSENTYINSTYFSYITDFTNSKYIKPTAVFDGEVVKNKNRVIVGIKFIQQ